MTLIGLVRMRERGAFGLSGMALLTRSAKSIASDGGLCRRGGVCGCGRKYEELEKESWECWWGTCGKEDIGDD
jgi:hypothetical protein